MTLSVLTIAGHDPSGGAGIQADSRVLESFGVRPLSVVTALTVQDSFGVRAVHPVAPAVFRDALRTILEDAPSLHAVKVGMLGSADQVEAVVELLSAFRSPNIVVDPVLASTDGVALLDDHGIELLVERLVPIATLVTPNVPEVERLQIDRLHGRANILVKGGHLSGDDAVDVLITRDGETIQFRSPRIDTANTHGTGCFLSAAIAANLALGHPLKVAIETAKRAMSVALHHSVVAGRGRGYPLLPSQPNADSFASASSARERVRGVYVITDATLHPGRSHEAIAEAAAEAGARVIQLRDKQLSTPELVNLAKRIRAITSRHGVTFVINDRVDVALAAGADGVHLGPEDMHPRDARRILGEHRIIGASVSSVAEAKDLATYVSYFGVGAIYGTRTKSDAGEAVGLGPLQHLKEVFPHHPLVAIGGIDTSNIAEVHRAGADAAAVISAVVNADDMRVATKALVARFGS